MVIWVGVFERLRLPDRGVFRLWARAVKTLLFVVYYMAIYYSAHQV